MIDLDAIRELTLVGITLVIWLYGLIDLITADLFPLGALLIILLIGSIHYLHVAPPSKEQVDAILGNEQQDGAEHNYIMKTVAHRGAGLDAPENSLEAFKMCKEKGCEAIEFDVQLTADDVPIVFHDSTLERLTGVNISVPDSKWEEIANIDISVNHPFRERFAKTNIPTLEQTVNQLLESGQRMFIDIKNYDHKLVKVINDLFEKHPRLYQMAIVTSFFPHIIYSIRKTDPKIVCSLARRPYATSHCSFNYPNGPEEPRFSQSYKHFLGILADNVSDWLLKRGMYYLLGISVLLLHKDMINGETVLFWRKRGIRVIAWSVNTPVEKQYFARHLKIPYLTDTLTGEASTHVIT